MRLMGKNVKDVAWKRERVVLGDIEKMLETSCYLKLSMFCAVR
jgi:hypothetical protein